MLLIRNLDNVFLISLLNWCYRTFSHSIFNGVCNGIEQALSAIGNIFIPIISIIAAIALYKYAFDQGIIIANLLLIAFGGFISWLMKGVFLSIDILLFLVSMFITLRESNLSKIISLLIFGIALYINFEKIRAFGNGVFFKGLFEVFKKVIGFVF